MDMTDNELLEQLFRPMKELQIADNGFTERVVSRLPQRDVRKLSHLWTAFCVVVAVALFVMVRGWEAVGYALLMWANNIGATQQQLLLFALSAGVAGLLVAAEVFNRERYSAI
jgi:hypothetical protein